MNKFHYLIKRNVRYILRSGFAIFTIGALVTLSACVTLPKVTATCTVTIQTKALGGGGTAYNVHLVSSGSADGVTLQDINAADLSSVFLNLHLQGAQITNSSGTYNLKLLNNGTVVAEHGFSYTVSGSQLIPSNPAAVKSWVSNYAGQVNSVQGTTDVRVTPGPSATQITATGTLLYSNTQLALAIARINIELHPKCPPGYICQPQ